jgi:hypothetical protein
MTSPRKGNTPLQMDIHPCGADVARTRRTVTPEFMTVANEHGTEHGAQSPWSPRRTDSVAIAAAPGNERATMTHRCRPRSGRQPGDDPGARGGVAPYGRGTVIPIRPGCRCAGDENQRHLTWHTAEWRAAMVKRIDVFYNNLRRHSSRGGTCPEQCTNRQKVPLTPVHCAGGTPR